MADGDFIELLESQSDRRDVNGRRRLSRTWLAEGLGTPEAVRNSPNYSVVVDGGDEFGLIFNSDDVRRHPDGRSSFVDGLYAEDLSFTFPKRLERDDLSFNEFSLTRQDVIDVIPTASLMFDAIKSETTGGVFVKHLWEASENRVDQTILVWNKEITLSKAQMTFSNIQKLEEQNNTLHQISTGPGTVPHWYRFTFGDIVPVSANEFVTTYSWERDPGVRDLLPNNNVWPLKPNTYLDEDFQSPDLTTAHPGGFQNPLSDEDPNIDWARPPFHRVSGIADGRDLPFGGGARIQNAPTFTITLKYPIIGDGSGWQNLPGSPLP